MDCKPEKKVEHLFHKSKNKIITEICRGLQDRRFVVIWGKGSNSLPYDDLKRQFVQRSDFCLFVLCTFLEIRFIGWRHGHIYVVNVNIGTCQLIAHASLSHIVQYWDLEGGETLGETEEDICALEKLFWKREKLSRHFNNGSDSGDNHSEDSSRKTEAFSLGSDFFLNSIQQTFYICPRHLSAIFFWRCCL